MRIGRIAITPASGTTVWRAQQARLYTENGALAGSRIISTGTGGMRCHGHWSNSARKHLVKTRTLGMPPFALM